MQAKPPLKIVLCSPRGFCAGVVRAIDTVERALTIYGAPVYVRHEIVHNRYVVDSLRTKGAIFVEELAEILTSYFDVAPDQDQGGHSENSEFHAERRPRDQEDSTKGRFCTRVQVSLRLLSTLSTEALEWCSFLTLPSRIS